MSDRFGPFNVAPRVIQRSTNFVDLLVRDRPGTDMYRLWGANSVNNAYGNPTGSGVAGTGPTMMMTVPKGQMGQSASVVRRGWRVEESRKGQTSFQFDPDDYVVPAVPPPFVGDYAPNYVRLQENRAGAWLASAGPVDPGLILAGPILIIPPARFYGESVAGTLNFTGIAPVGTGSSMGELPMFDPSLQSPQPMHIIFPKTCTNILVTPQEAGKTLLMSFGLDDPMITVQDSNPFTMDSSRGIKEIVLAAKDAACPFNIHVVMGHMIEA